MKLEPYFLFKLDTKWADLRTGTDNPAHIRLKSAITPRSIFIRLMNVSFFPQFLSQFAYFISSLTLRSSPPPPQPPSPPPILLTALSLSLPQSSFSHSVFSSHRAREGRNLGFQTSRPPNRTGFELEFVDGI
ncbi:hypothetical protein DM860_001866 [Cuscuta australis]|uniref:Uncharacterized protein n=1 Tax=Cuscuta australis TaxID=267555 RepID=A0A328EDI6_9ASTE|nr:hypothetical protein DM860_001866 [Cuscuta australis]